MTSKKEKAAEKWYRLYGYWEDCGWETKAIPEIKAHLAGQKTGYARAMRENKLNREAMARFDERLIKAAEERRDKHPKKGGERK